MVALEVLCKADNKFLYCLSTDPHIFLLRSFNLMYLAKKIFLIETDFSKQRVIHGLFLNFSFLFRGAFKSRIELNLVRNS